MIVNRNELVPILSALRPGLNKKEFVQQSCHFLFFEDKIAVYNDKISITHPYQSESTFSVKGEEFYKILEGINDDDVDISIKNQKLKIKAKTTSSEMTLLTDDQNTIAKKINALEENMGGWKKLPDNFIEALTLCSFSASPDLTTGIKSCVCFVGDVAHASDGYRASRFFLNKKMPFDFNIPAKTAFELIKFPITECCISNKWLCFKTEEGVIFSCSSIEGEFPIEKANTLFSEMEKLEVIELPSELEKTIKEVLILASDDSSAGKKIDITLDENMLYVKAENELGYVKKTIEIDYEYEPVRIIVNSNFFIQILDKALEMYIGKQALFFATPNFNHVMTKTQVSKEED